MKRAKWYLPLLLVSMLLFVGGACGPPELPSPPTLPEPTPYSTVSIPIEEFPNHPHIDVVMHAVVGEELTVTLGSNPTTGFRWSEFAEISDETIVQQTSHKYVGKEYEVPPPPGTSGEEVWTFKALKKGTTTISMEYSRPWIEEDIGHWTVTITANIKL
jgi:inhibitor of cysteine peptidase